MLMILAMLFVIQSSVPATGGSGHDRAAAVHETAHAAIGHVLGLACGGAEIYEDRTGFAMVQPPPTWDPCAVRNYLAMSMAAAEAEKRSLKMSDTGDAEDRKRQEKMAARVGLGQSLGKIRACAGTLVDLHREDIRTVARALPERRRLSAEEIDGLLR